MNRYLEDKAMRRSRMRDRRSMMKDRRDMYMDKRNPYGSRGGYVSPSRKDRYSDYYDYREDYAEDYEHYESMPFKRREGLGRYGYHNDFASDYSYDMHDMEKEYREHLHKWTEKLKKKDKLKVSKEQIINIAKQMDIKFEDYSEEELYATYLMMVSDYTKLPQEPRTYIVMAKQFLEDDDTELKGSEKLCAYLYTIVLGEEE
jgi:hypothetical protein